MAKTLSKEQLQLVADLIHGGRMLERIADTGAITSDDLDGLHYVGHLCLSLVAGIERGDFPFMDIPMSESGTLQ